MTLFTVVIKNMRQRSLASVLTITSIALGVALVAAILLINWLTNPGLVLPDALPVPPSVGG